MINFTYFVVPFLDLYDWLGIEYPKVMKRINYTLSGKNNLEIALNMFYI